MEDVIVQVQEELAQPFVLLMETGVTGVNGAHVTMGWNPDTVVAMIQHHQQVLLANNVKGLLKMAIKDRPHHVNILLEKFYKNTKIFFFVESNFVFINFRSN